MKNKVKLGFITIDLNNIKDLYTREYKDFINEFSNEYKDLVLTSSIGTSLVIIFNIKFILSSWMILYNKKTHDFS
jgi:hypothetical protein